MGRVLIVGGSREYTGALYLAGVAALRSGAESVLIMAPEKVAWAINALSPDLMTRKLRGTYLSQSHERAIRKQLKTADVLLIGNGATTRPGAAALMRRLMRWKGLKVVDADALKVLRKNEVSNAILTPNEGEWKLLDRHNDIRKLLANGNVIIRKGGRTEIVAKGKKFRMRQVNPGLSKAGMGDVLAGLCAGYLAKGFAPLRASCEAARVGNEVAALLTKKKRGYFFLASDLVQELKKRVLR
ncbi:MAG: NAD(P)H-hydrate dehydratase [bacterium]|nr:NAD(P)H-hydrate dehydratase [bacterium]